MLLGELLQIGTTRHGAVVVHDLADHPGRLQTRQARQIHGRLGLPHSLQDAARLGAKRKDVPGSGQVGRPRFGVHRDLDRECPIVNADPGGYPQLLARVDRDGERGFVRVRELAVGHEGQLQPIRDFLREREADQPAPVRAHEVDPLRSNLLRRTDEIPLVFPVLIVSDDDHPAASNRFYRVLDHAVEGVRHESVACPVGLGGPADSAGSFDPAPPRFVKYGWRSLRTYFPIRSASTFTRPPGRNRENAVWVHV